MNGQGSEMTPEHTALFMTQTEREEFAHVLKVLITVSKFRRERGHDWYALAGPSFASIVLKRFKRPHRKVVITPSDVIGLPREEMELALELKILKIERDLDKNVIE